MQRRLNSETSLLKIVYVRGVFRNFLRERASIFVTFFKPIFPAELFLSNLSAKIDSSGVRGHAPPENFRKFAYCNGHFSAF